MTDLGKPTVAVVAFGRPQGLTPVIDRLPAVLTAYYGGPHQATAIADTATGATLPMQQLVGFVRVDLEPGAAETVTFAVPMSLLAYTGLSGGLVMDPGPVELSAGSSSSDIRSAATFTVTGRIHTISGEDRAFLSVATVGPKE